MDEVQEHRVLQKGKTLDRAYQSLKVTSLIFGKDSHTLCSSPERPHVATSLKTLERAFTQSQLFLIEFSSFHQRQLLLSLAYTTLGLQTVAAELPSCLAALHATVWLFSSSPLLPSHPLSH